MKARPTMQVIITRPESDAMRTADEVAHLGFEPVIAPLAQVVKRNIMVPAQSYDGIIITSRHALEGIDAPSLAPHLATPIYCVGTATAERAKKAGFRSIRPPAATVDDLVLLIQEHLKPHQSWLYLAGEPRKSAIEKQLAEKVTLEICISYHLEDLSHFPADALDKITDSHPIWLHYSEKSAERAAILVSRSPLSDLFHRARHLVLSPSIGKTVRDLGGGEITIAKQPNQASLLQALLTMRQG